MIVHVYNSQDDLLLSSDSVRKTVEEVLLKEKWRTDEVHLHFVSLAEISSLHQTYFNDPTPTDCISFPLDQEGEEEGSNVLGEVFVCPKVALDYAKEHAIDPYLETTRYVIHGLLHLMGYEDETAAKRKVMKAKEEALLQTVLQLEP